MYTQTIPLSTQIVNSFFPLKLIIDPSNLSLPNKVRQIDYIWGDGTTISVSYKPDPNIDLDPLKQIQSKIYNMQNVINNIVYIKINVYTFGSQFAKSYFITLNLQYPSLENYFGSFHLIKSRMFGANNDIIYTFETQAPNSILMSLVNWSKNVPPITPQNLSRPYNYVLPFAQQFTNNKNIEIVGADTNTEYNSDNPPIIRQIYP